MASELDTQLWLATKSNDVEKVKVLLDQGAAPDVQIFYPDKNSPELSSFHVAVMNAGALGKKEIYTIFLNQIKNLNYESIGIIYIYKESISPLDFLLNKSVLYNEVPPNIQEIAIDLINKGADPFYIGNKFEKPYLLERIFWEGDGKIDSIINRVKHLSPPSGILQYLINDWIFRSYINGDAGLKKALALFQKHKSFLDENGFPASAWFSTKDYYPKKHFGNDLSARGHIEGIKILKNFGVDLNKNYGGSTICESYNLGKLEQDLNELVSLGCKFSQNNIRKLLEIKNYPLADKLLPHGVDLDRDLEGYDFPLLFYFSDNLDALQWLLRKGAHVKVYKSDTHIPFLHYFLVESNLFYEKSNEAFEMLKQIVEGGADLNEVYAYRNTTALQQLIYELKRVSSRKYEITLFLIANKLIELGADPNFNTENGYSPLVEASFYMYAKEAMDFVKVALSRGANPAKLTMLFEKTIYYGLAESCKDQDCANLFTTIYPMTSNLIDYEAENRFPRPLCVAISSNNPVIVRSLLSVGADHKSSCESNKSPYEISKKYPEIKKVFEEFGIQD